MESVAGTELTVNGRSYPRPDRPVVVVCIDGSEDAYHERAIADGLMPFTEGMLARGSDLRGACTMPSFTNPNNLSIATGVPPAVHGICGNYFYDAEAGEEVMMNAPELLRAPTVFAEFARTGAKVAVITAKDKLRRLLGSGLDLAGGAVCFSAEKADRVSLAEHGIEKVLEATGFELPSVYSAELSELVMAAGCDVLERDRPDLMYLSLTDYIQHKHAPGSPVANAFYAMLDRYFARIDALGAVLVVTADHGMNAKSDGAGEARVVFLSDWFDAETGAGASRVVLPITDPYTVHHGALGSYATVHLPDGADREGLRQRLGGVAGVDTVLTREEACARFELPGDRIGDLVVIAERNTVLGTTAARHDISGFKEPLRSHGGLTEQRVPVLVNRPVELPAGHRLRNFDAYWIGCHAAAGQPLPA
jgi:phosphonoacetate hydrolase